MRLATAWALASLAVAPAGAQEAAPDRWAAVDGAAEAILPAARGTDGVREARLSCAAQQWTLTLTLADEAGAMDGTATLVVDGRDFAADVTATASALIVAVPREAIDPLRRGVMLALKLDGETKGALGDPAFPLRGSRVAIDAAAELCSLRDMTGYQPVTLTPYSSYVGLVRALRADDVKAFSAATASEPKVEAAMLELDEGRRLLVTRLCGSSWYFGSSGCNVTAFVPSKPAEAGSSADDAAAADEGAENARGEADDWRAVYDTENVHLYTDPSALTDGWPAIATLPTRSDGTALLWRWDGQAYDLVGEMPEQRRSPLGLRTGID